MLRATSHDCNLGERHTSGISGMEMCVCEQKGKKQLAGHSTLADKAMKHSGSGSSSRPPSLPAPC